MWKTRIFIVVFSLLTSISCELIFFDDDYKFLPERIETAMIMRSQYVQNSSTELAYDIDVVLLSEYEDLVDNTYLQKEDFKFSDPTYTSLVPFDVVSVKQAATPSSILLMVDQSGSYEDVDPYNVRSQAISKMLYDIQTPHRILLSGFSRGGLIDEPVEWMGQNFLGEGKAFQESLFSLAKQTGGTSSLYDALDVGLDRLLQADVQSRKELVVLARSGDAGSSQSMVSIVQKAKANQIRIHSIVLGNNVGPESLAPVSLQTGGIYASCPTTKELTTVFSHLHRILNGKADVYRIRVRYKPNNAVIQPGFELIQTLSITDDSYDFDFNPVYTYVKVP
ncbi:MAG: vWA domain-containing protein [Bacteroidota bacterium]